MMTPIPTLEPLTDRLTPATPPQRVQACLHLATLLTAQWPTQHWTVALLHAERESPTARPMAVLVQWTGHAAHPEDLADFVRLVWISLLPGELLDKAGFCVMPARLPTESYPQYQHYLMLCYSEGS